jgi:hypothetical protein
LQRIRTVLSRDPKIRQWLLIEWVQRRWIPLPCWIASIWQLYCLAISS